MVYNWHRCKYDFIADISEEPKACRLPNDLAQMQFGRKRTIRGPAKVGPTLIRSNWTEWASDRIFQETTCDDVMCMRCIDWPSEARQWFSRERKHGWPDEDTIRNVWNGGCHVVPVAHPDYKFDRFQWRYSFSRSGSDLAPNLDSQSTNRLSSAQIFHETQTGQGVRSGEEDCLQLSPEDDHVVCMRTQKSQQMVELEVASWVYAVNF